MFARALTREWAASRQTGSRSACAVTTTASSTGSAKDPFARKYGIDLHALAAEFATESPKAAEIRQAKRERENGF